MKNRKVVNIFTTFFCGLALCGLIGTWKIEEIHDAVKMVRTGIAERKAYKYRNDALLDLSKLSSLEKDADAWYYRYSVIAHSGG